MLNFAKSGLNETLVQFSPSLHFVMMGSDFFPILLENTYIAEEIINTVWKDVMVII